MGGFKLAIIYEPKGAVREYAALALNLYTGCTHILQKIVADEKSIKNKDIRQMPAKGRDLIGDYGNISESGQYIHRRLMPFYSWFEINAPGMFTLCGI